MRRSDQPNRPSATIWWCLSSAKTLLMPRRNAGVPRRRQRLEPLLEMAGFQLSINGRFWVSTEVGTRHEMIGSLGRPLLKLPTRLRRGTTRSTPTCDEPPHASLHLPDPRRTWRCSSVDAASRAAGCHWSAPESPHAETGGRFDDSHRLWQAPVRFEWSRRTRILTRYCSRPMEVTSWFESRILRMQSK
jgi:hypothetical protein